MKAKGLMLFRLFFPILLGGISGFIIKDSIQYNSLIKPPFSPPSILFPIVWTILYLLMGLSFYFYKKEYPEADEVTFFYYLQLFFNITWTFLFFLFRMRVFSILWILVLVFLVILLLRLFYQKKKLSFYFLILYLPWLLFATYLNIGIALLN